jgi:hypothetical protein
MTPVLQEHPKWCFLACVQFYFVRMGVEFSQSRAASQLAGLFSVEGVTLENVEAAYRRLRLKNRALSEEEIRGGLKLPVRGVILVFSRWKTGDLHTTVITGKNQVMEPFTGSFVPLSEMDQVFAFHDIWLSEFQILRFQFHNPFK